MCVAYGVAGAWGFLRGERRGLAGRCLAFDVRAGASASRTGEREREPSTQKMLSFCAVTGRSKLFCVCLRVGATTWICFRNSPSVNVNRADFNIKAPQATQIADLLPLIMQTTSWASAEAVYQSACRSRNKTPPRATTFIAAPRPRDKPTRLVQPAGDASGSRPRAAASPPRPHRAPRHGSSETILDDGALPSPPRLPKSPDATPSGAASRAHPRRARGPARPAPASPEARLRARAAPPRPLPPARLPRSPPSRPRRDPRPRAVGRL